MLEFRTFVRSVVLLAALASPALASTVDLTTGTTMVLHPSSTFNETRGADVTVLSASNQVLTSMTLSSLNIFSPTATVGARVYESSPPFLIAAAQTSVTTGSNQSVTLPISATLVSGRSYRLCFFVDAGGFASGTLYDPSPSGFPGFPYTESSGVLRINQGYAIASDALPTNLNTSIPAISLDVCAQSAQFDLASGTTGTTLAGQSFNHTRGVAVTVNAGCGDIVVGSVTIQGLNVVLSSATVGARIYDDGSTQLLAAADTVVGVGNNQSVTVPVNLALDDGRQYRVCWFNQSASGSVNGAVFDPTAFPYTEPNGRITMLAAYSAPTDSFPTSTNAFVPKITLNTTAEHHVDFCFGDGTDPSHTTACPCGNNGAARNGCANSVNSAGGHLSASGATNPDAVVLAGSGMPQTVTCIYIQQDALGDSTFGDGVNCGGGNLIRLRAKSNSNGASQFPDGTDTVTVSQRGGVTPGSGVTRYYAAYYRNAAAAFCPPLTFNITNATRILW